MQIKVHILKSFTNDSSQGNPVGIVFDADNLTAEQMMSIVQKTGYSECAFIQNWASSAIVFLYPVTLPTILEFP